MLGKTIARLRKSKGLTQAKFADMIHVTQGAVSQWETGRTSPDVQQMFILADFFGVSVEELSTGRTSASTVPAGFSGPIIGGEFNRNKKLPATAIDLGQGELKPITYPAVGSAVTLDGPNDGSTSPYMLDGHPGYGKSQKIAQILAELETCSDEKLDDYIAMMRLMKK